MLSKSVTFLDFQISQGSVAICCSCGGNLCGMYIENFHMNQLVKSFENQSTFAQLIIRHQGVYILSQKVVHQIHGENFVNS